VRVAERWGSGAPVELAASPELLGDFVRFRFFDGSRRLRGVELFAAFDEWRSEPLRRVAPGEWTLERRRPATGRWPYAFRVSDGRWLPDAGNPRRAADGFGGWSSVLEVGAASATSRSRATSQK
jgi:hypothetical protein